MRLHERRLRTLTAGVCMVAAVTCAKPADPGAHAGSVRVGVVAPPGGGPRGQVVGLGYLTGALVGETLVSIDARGQFQPRLIERWERSEDGRTWRFHLKKGVTFHNGALLNTALVVPAVRSQLGPLGDAESVTEIDDTTFEVVQRRASAFLLDGLVNVGINAGDSERSGTGPFLADASVAGRVRFRAFDAYHRGAPSIREVGLQQYADQRNAWAALMRSEIDVLYEVSPEARDFVETESSVAVSAFIRPYTYLLGFNLRHEPFKDKRVRRALNLAVDRNEIIRTALRGRGEAAYDHLWPRHWAVDASRAAYVADKQAAVRLLEAGGKNTLTSRETGGMPHRFTFHCLVYAPLEKLALAVQRELASIDVEMTVELLSVSEMGRRIGSGQFEAFLFELANARILGYTYSFWHSQSAASVRTGYSSADTALDQVRYARNDDEMRTAIRAVQDVMRDDPPAVFLAYPQVARAVSRRFDIPSGEEDIFHTIARWKLAAKPSN